MNMGFGQTLQDQRHNLIFGQIALFAANIKNLAADLCFRITSYNVCYTKLLRTLLGIKRVLRIDCFLRSLRLSSGSDSFNHANKENSVSYNFV